MPTPSKPTLDYSYTAFQASQGTNTFPGTFIDNDLENLKAAIDETIDFVSPVIRSDGKLQNGVVGKSALSSDLLLGVAPPREWASAVAYAVDETVTINNSVFICTVAHTSAVFVTDQAVGRWALVFEFTDPIAPSDGSITEPKHADGGVSTRALAAAAVTEAKIATGAVSATKLASAVSRALMPIGAELDFAGVNPPAGWLLAFGQTVSRVTYSDLLTAMTASVTGNTANGSLTITGVSVDLRNLGLEGSPIEGLNIPGGATVASVTINTIVLSANATGTTSGVQIRIFPHGNGDGSSTFTLPDMRDRTGVGRGNMGGTAAARQTPAAATIGGFNTSRLGAVGGSARVSNRIIFTGVV
jgi:hypothetical protein